MNFVGVKTEIAFMLDWFTPKQVPGIALEDFRSTVRRRAPNSVIGQRIEQILRMGVKPFTLAGFEPKLKNANPIILKANSKFLASCRVRGVPPCG
jgi:hypothetical protein